MDRKLFLISIEHQITTALVLELAEIALFLISIEHQITTTACSRWQGD